MSETRDPADKHELAIGITVSLGSLTRIKSLVGLLHLVSTRESNAKTARKMRDFADEINIIADDIRDVIYRLERFLKEHK